MQKSFTVLLWIVLFCFHQLWGKTFEVGVGASVASANNYVKDGMGYNLHLDYITPTAFAFKTSIGRYAADTNVDKLSEGDYSLFWFEQSILLRAKLPVIIPYCGVGGGYYIPKQIVGGDVQNALKAAYNLKIDEDIKNTLGFLVRAGFNLNFTHNFSINGDVKYIFIKV